MATTTWSARTVAPPAVVATSTPPARRSRPRHPGAARGSATPRSRGDPGEARGTAWPGRAGRRGPGGRYSPACQSGEWTSAWTASRSRNSRSRRARPPRRPRPGTRRPGTAGRRATACRSPRGRSRCRASRVNAISPRRLSRPSRSSRSSSSGKWRIPLARPWVRLASQKPPFRPLAPNATVSASRTTTRSAGSVSVSAIAVHRPVNPAPTIATSASRRRRPSGGSQSPGAGSRSQ